MGQTGGHGLLETHKVLLHPASQRQAGSRGAHTLAAAVVGVGAALQQAALKQQLDDAGDLGLVAPRVLHQVALRGAVVAREEGQATRFHRPQSLAVISHGFPQVAPQAMRDVVQAVQHVGVRLSCHRGASMWLTLSSNQGIIVVIINQMKT